MATHDELRAEIVRLALTELARRLRTRPEKISTRDLKAIAKSFDRFRCSGQCACVYEVAGYQKQLLDKSVVMSAEEIDEMSMILFIRLSCMGEYHPDPKVREWALVQLPYFLKHKPKEKLQ